MRKIFIPWELYLWIQNLSNNDKGLLFDIIYKYNLWLDYEIPKELEMVFWFFKPFFDNDIEVYKKFCESRKNNGIKWWRPKKNWDNSQKPRKATKPRKANEPTKPTEMKWNDIDNDIYKLYNNNIYITNKEYNILLYDYWKEIIDWYILDLENYIINNPKWKYVKDCNLTIRNRLRRNWIKKKEHTEVKPNLWTDNFFTSLQKQIWQS